MFPTQDCFVAVKSCLLTKGLVDLKENETEKSFFPQIYLNIFFLAAKQNTFDKKSRNYSKQIPT